MIHYFLKRSESVSSNYLYIELCHFTQIIEKKIKSPVLSARYIFVNRYWEVGQKTVSILVLKHPESTFIFQDVKILYQCFALNFLKVEMNLRKFLGYLIQLP